MGERLFFLSWRHSNVNGFLYILGAVVVAIVILRFAGLL